MARSAPDLAIPDGCLPGPEKWCFAPEGAAILPSAATAVIADVHLGYEWARGRSGDFIPEHSLRESISKLERLLTRIPEIKQLIVAGDLTESNRPCPQTARDLIRFRHWLRDREIELIWIAGNHDRPQRPPLPSSFAIGGWTITHGHRQVAESKIVIGHHHPALRASGIVAPCFVVDENTIMLPAFSENAAGLDLLNGPLPNLIRPSMRCVAGLGRELLDFGPLARLRHGQI